MVPPVVRVPWRRGGPARLPGVRLVFYLVEPPRSSCGPNLLFRPQQRHDALSRPRWVGRRAMRGGRGLLRGSVRGISQCPARYMRGPVLVESEESATQFRRAAPPPPPSSEMSEPPYGHGLALLLAELRSCADDSVDGRCRCFGPGSTLAPHFQAAANRLRHRRRHGQLGAGRRRNVLSIIGAARGCKSFFSFSMKARYRSTCPRLACRTAPLTTGFSAQNSTVRAISPGSAMRAMVDLSVMGFALSSCVCTRGMDVDQERNKDNWIIVCEGAQG